ncbi:histidine kinase dimerization/phospho-acceptor domain-containing protein [Lysinibacillus irui]|uniref:histidine kinase n=1 Tax=Lysinibacillus irui TaxID=2998077 RepID=A0ABU5NGS2_9BACI|nr:histidine kinase dimerization/phospho-acceptor domain-containing protein [Lysinibacillus irui]MEA0553826.1 histidine kinase dimerization/phospho-acceptor domain-containing protein [Lysinibacillus irui]MEA0975232.1 histidine kinase dimerization/phospho-acceptor domain-containing protein [Lysinibacillus irui]MEA1041386.1 histidine kinase dimerization/phospho-acceptor domain-containing protein [Lysinibacillus irui]
MIKKWRSLFVLMCLIWTIFGIFTFWHVGYQYIGKSYFDSENFQHEIDNFTAELGPLVINVPKAEDLKNKIEITQTEIEDHRNYYGTLGQQIDNIKAQYEQRIQEAIDANATELKTKLETERDNKIKDITANFEDDEHVRKKILAEKEVLIDKYIKDVQSEAKNFEKNFDYWSYELKNTETGKTYRAGDVTESSVYKIKYTERNPLYAGNISNNFRDTFYRTETYVNVDDLYETTEYTGVLTISKKAVQTLGVMQDYSRFHRNQYTFFLVWLTSIVTAFFVWRGRKGLLQTVKDMKEKEILTKVKFDFQVVLVLITGFIYLIASQVVFESIEYTYEYNYQHNYVRYILDLAFKLGVLFVIGSAFFVQLIWLYTRVDTLKKLEENVKSSYLWSLGDSMTDLFINRSIALHSIVMLAAAFFGGGSLVASMLRGGAFQVLVLGLCTFVGVPALIVFLSRMGYLNRIMKDTKDMAEGRLNRDVKVKGKSPLAGHAENLNHLREGVRTSMHQQAKSERLKTELITNVSHDLRTPLTSIITYTDLLKNPTITDEERQQYIHILDKKSERLKVLIEDLFEVSKMASGNIELQRSRVDLTQLIQQAVGEHKEDLSQSRLDLRMTMPHDPIYAYVDGQKWWRLIDNLIVNVLKYALEGTRVYVTLKRTADGDAEFTVKNVAKYEISEDADELFERFKRADASRHTEGSGLGLAIAQSIVDLHGARMTIDVDGDLFKVTVRISAV